MTRNVTQTAPQNGGARYLGISKGASTAPHRAPNRAPRLTSTFTNRAPAAPQPRLVAAPPPLYRRGALATAPLGEGQQ